MKKTNWKKKYIELKKEMDNIERYPDLAKVHEELADLFIKHNLSDEVMLGFLEMEKMILSKDLGLSDQMEDWNGFLDKFKR